VIIGQTQKKLTGLTSQEAGLRLGKFGPNELKKHQEHSSLKIFFNQFESPLIYILVFAGVVTFFLRDFTDTIVIFAAVFLNTALGFYQEQKSQKSMRALKSLITSVVKVIRDDNQKIIESKNLVPGDLVILTIGTRIPADGLLVESTDLTVDESILTGESMPIAKKAGSSLGVSESVVDKQHQMVFMGTMVTTGIAKIIITKTGMETKVGQIGHSLIEMKEEKTPLQIEIGKLAKTLALVVGMMTIFIFLFGRFLDYQFLEMFTTSIAVAVAAIPEGLPVSFTVVLALGMQRILRRKAVVRRLLATETLGSVSVICADKTGTLTEGQMEVVESLVGQDKQKLVQAAFLCNDMRDPLEIAMMSWAKKEIAKSKGKIVALKNEYQKIDEIPFNPIDKYIATLHQEKKSGEKFLFFSGAPEVILNKSKLTTKEKEELLKKFQEYGQQGYRLVGFAYKKLKFPVNKIKEDDLKAFVWLGILIFEDPIRKGVKETLEECQRAGIKVKVITGDYLATALAILKKLGIKNHKKALEGKDLEKINDEKLKETVKEVILFARTTPEQKLRIVRSLKQNGEVVAMMGDGVNDAPALKQADIGIVVESASDVAKETADIVLLDSNFATIIHAIEEGRNIFENIRKIVLYLLSSSFTEIILIGGSILLGLPLPLAAAQILWINLIEDTFPAIGLVFEPWERELMMVPPRQKTTPILSPPMKFLIFGVGIFLNVFLLLLFWALNKGFLHLSSPQTFMFVALGINFLFVPFACRSLRKPIFKFNPFSNKILNLTLAFGFILLISAVYLPPLQLVFKTHPLGINEWIFLSLLGFFSFLIIELVKWTFILKKRNL